MHIVTRLIIALIALSIAGLIDFLFFTFSYGALRIVRIPVRWITLAIGWFIIAISVVATLAAPFYPSAGGVAAIMGIFSFGIGVYASLPTCDSGTSVLRWRSLGQSSSTS